MFAMLNRNLLKSVMLADGVFSLVAAVGLFAFTAPLGALAGPAATPGVFQALSAFFLLWGLFHLAVGRSDNPSPAAVRFAIAGDALWIIGSLVLVALAGDGLTFVGKVAVVVVAVAVADILLLKVVGLGRRQRVAA